MTYLNKESFKTRSYTIMMIGVCLTLLASGCSRRFYRNRADNEVHTILANKDKYLNWKLEQFHLLPDPRARFASAGNQDRPAMPPDDPASMEMAPNPQKPGKSGIAHMEGSGYLDILSQFDAENRSTVAIKPPKDNNSSLKLVSFKQDGINYLDNLDPDKGPFDSMGLTYNGDPAGRYNHPFLIKLEQSCELGLVNSRDFQFRRENVYLAALPVTLQRFAFAAQFYANEVAIRERSGTETLTGNTNRWNVASEAGVTKTFSTGALLLLRYANSVVVDMAGNGATQIRTPSAVSLDIFQPLFRGGGRAVTLEPLTLAERNLLYEMRSFARFRKEFYTDIAVGGAPVVYSTPATVASASRFNTVFGSGLAGAGFVQVTPGEGNGYSSTPQAFTARRDGYLPAVLKAGLLRNERENVADLSTTLDQYKEMQAIGDISELQVSRILQQLLSFKTSVINRELSLRDALDRFKYQLGLPIDLPLELDRTPLEPQLQQLARYSNLVDEFKKARQDSRKLNDPKKVDQLRNGLRNILKESEFVKGTQFKERLPKRWAAWEAMTKDELTAKLREINARRLQLQESKADYEKKGKKQPSTEKVELGEKDFEFFLGRFERNLRLYEQKVNWLRNGVDDQLNQFENLIEDFLLVLVEPRNEKLEKTRKSWPAVPRVCVDGVDLLKTDIDEALFAGCRHALTNRLDLMNGRAQLMDSWRQIAISANALQGVLNVEYSLLGTSPANVAQPVNINASSLRHRLILTGDLPLVRIQERNAYRATLINWQRQRRNLMAFEDTIIEDVRNEIRQLRALSQTYDIQKLAVELAYLILDNALETTYAPSKPGGAGGAQGNNDSSQAAFTQQLLDAQRSKLTAQNTLFQIWIDFLTTRTFLYRDLELLPLDPRGVWIDEIETCQCDPPAIRTTQTTTNLGGLANGDEGTRGGASSFILPPRKISLK
jgi:hypothetical protein